MNRRRKASSPDYLPVSGYIFRARLAQVRFERGHCTDERVADIQIESVATKHRIHVVDLHANLVVFSLLLIRAILLARWLPIEVFGIYAMASAVVELSSILADLGLGEAFLHRAPEPWA